MNIPSGNVTFLFTDIEGSTKLAQDFPDTILTALEKHHAIVRKAIETNNGFVFEIVGDAFCCAFENADDAVKAAVDVHLNLGKEKWTDAVIKVRIGIHSGSAEWNENKYAGYITLARTARVMSAAYGEQIIISNYAYELAIEKIRVTNRKIRNQNNDTEILFRDLGERRLKDVIQPVRLFQIISKGLREDFPPLKTLDARPNNLPVQLTSFIGREEEMKRIKDLLKQTHLLTLTGSGGAGKTRLALQIAADVIDDFVNGVWFVELASLSKPAFLPQPIMKVFGIKEEPKKSLEDTLCDYLKDKEILIILDNCEHLIEPCAILAEKLLSNNPKLKIITTSRESLNCQGEQSYRLPSLSLPDSLMKLSPEQISQFESVRLFIERAISVKHDFRLDENNSAQVAGICKRLDGIPLAIELAAARIRFITVEKIYEKLDNRFSLLTGGNRTSLPRQQTLKALIDWSYDLLSENEKILWNRLTVFNGGWDLEAAENICSDEKVTGSEIFDLLSQLTEKSIIIYEEDKDRYRILETIKEYGAAKLKENNESDKIFLKHLEYYHLLSTKTEFGSPGNDSAIFLNKMESEHSNLISAIERSVIINEKEKGGRLAVALGMFWIIRGHYSTGIRLINILLHDTQGITQATLPIIFTNAGNLYRSIGEFEKAKVHYEKSLDLSREFGDEQSIATALQGLGNISAEFGDYETARKHYEESLCISRKIGFRNSIAFALNNLGNIAFISGDFEKAISFAEESLAINREDGNKRSITFSLDTLGNISTEQGDYENAEKYLDESLSLNRELGDKSGIAFTLNNLGAVAKKMNDFEKAQKLYEESLSMRRSLGDKISIAYTLQALGVLLLEKGNGKKAKKYFEESLNIRMELGDKSGTVLCINSLFLDFGNDENIIQAVKVLGAVETFGNSIRLFVNEKESEIQEEKKKQLRLKLSDDEYEKYFEEGKKLTLEQTVELAVSNINVQ